jgi:hypothetical protein
LRLINYMMILGYIRNVFSWMSPFILFLLSLGVLVYCLGENFDKYITFVSVTIWPVTILLALAFFRKVFTYLFFSMNAYNFFGAKGELKDVTQVIEESVEKRIKEEKEELKRGEELKSIAESIEKAKLSRDNAEKKAKENLDLAKDIFEKYKEVSEKYAEALKEVEEFRTRNFPRKSNLTTAQIRAIKGLLVSFKFDKEEIQNVDDALRGNEFVVPQKDDEVSDYKNLQIKAILSLLHSYGADESIIKTIAQILRYKNLSKDD